MPEQTDPILAMASRTERKRPRYTFPIPQSARSVPEDPSSITMVPITVEEEQMALKAAQAGDRNLEYELVKMALVAADGKPLDWAGGVRDELFVKVSPPVRQLFIAGFEKIHSPSKAAREDFLGGMKVEV